MSSTGLRFRRRPGFRVKVSPTHVLLLGYAVLVLSGAALLKLPFSVNKELSWLEAVFTSASAVTVTGLSVVDTGSEYTLFGQVIIAVLIQLGGLGLMTFAVLIFTLLGLPIPMRHRLILSEDLNHTDLGGILGLVGSILTIVLVVEAIGALFLCLVFIPEFGFAQGLWTAVFHSVSAFNNAGFSFFPDSLSKWVGNPIINITIPMLFILGGLGFSVIADVASGRRWRALTLHTKLMLVGTVVLVVWSCVGFAALEWSNGKTLGALATSDRLWATWFQATTVRTAGFNTVDISALRDSTSILLISMMLIGGGATSTAGGIKVTTFVVLVLASVAFLRRREHISAFGRSIAPDQILKVLTLVVLCLLILLTGVFLISVTNGLAFIDIVFEVASAFGTVGLSKGITGQLDAFGQIIIIMIMFIGRVGPLALGVLFATSHMARVRYPSAQVYLG